MAKMRSTVELQPEVASEQSKDRKKHGVHYTPPGLARFVAKRALPGLSKTRSACVLDPACGDGELLLAIAVEAAKAGLPAPHLIGIDRDEAAISAAGNRLDDAPAETASLQIGDFLAVEARRPEFLPEHVDLVISNPPYVRTQVLGASRARTLAQRFDLTGRIDLYHAFAAEITNRLADQGVLALLCSNRFLSTRGGRSLRTLLEQCYEIAEIWDLGDSKLFEAAVLPAVVVARRGREDRGRPGSYVRVYEDEKETERAKPAEDLLDELDEGTKGSVRVDKRRFVIERGELSKPQTGQPWQLRSSSSSRWLGTVRKRSAGRFGDLGRIRVGIKTTADKVFIRSSWDDLPPELRPEDSLLHPLLTHRLASRWRARHDGAGARSVLYTHEVHEGKRRAIELAAHPRAAAYLEQHRAQLEGRTYLRKAGRSWYEIWVPQRPDGWAAPKLVWPDISESPRFFLDRSGSIVNGDCYWLSCADLAADELALAIAVANSSFAVRYYDLCCGNRLYAGRRRFITQYVEELPLPSASSAATSDIGAMVGRLQRPDVDAETQADLEAALDRAVDELFGLKKPARQM